MLNSQNRCWNIQKSRTCIALGIFCVDFVIGDIEPLRRTWPLLNIGVEQPPTSAEAKRLPIWGVLVSRTFASSFFLIRTGVTVMSGDLTLSGGSVRSFSTESSRSGVFSLCGERMSIVSFLGVSFSLEGSVAQDFWRGLWNWWRHAQANIFTDAKLVMIHDVTVKELRHHNVYFV